jgi:hypothetical protein
MPLDPPAFLSILELKAEENDSQLMTVVTH